MTAGGAVLPFDARSKGKLREILEAMAILAMGGVKLLQHLPDKGDGTA